MGYDLTNIETGAEFRVQFVAWHKALALGRLYGWVPAGTRPRPEYGNLVPDPDDEREHPTLYATDRAAFAADWPTLPLEDQYVVNERQRVTTEDATAWAEALTRALPDIPDHADPAEKVVTIGDVTDPEQVAALGWLGPHVGVFLGGGGMARTPDARLGLLQFFSGPEKAGLREFITFLRLGEFRID